MGGICRRTTPQTPEERRKSVALAQKLNKISARELKKLEPHKAAIDADIKAQILAGVYGPGGYPLNSPRLRAAHFVAAKACEEGARAAAKLYGDVDFKPLPKELPPWKPSMSRHRR